MATHYHNRDTPCKTVKRHVGRLYINKRTPPKTKTDKIQRTRENVWGRKNDGRKYNRITSHCVKYGAAITKYTCEFTPSQNLIPANIQSIKAKEEVWLAEEGNNASLVCVICVMCYVLCVSQGQSSKHPSSYQ